MCNALKIIALTMCIIVHWVNAPFVACTVMFFVHKTVHQRVAHMHIRRSHVDFCPQPSFAVLEFAILHALEQVEVFLNRTVTERALDSWSGWCTPLLTNNFGRLIIDICLASFYQFDSEIVE